MKILYIANDPSAAELAGFALGHLAPNVSVLWAAGLDDARRCIDEDRYPSALIAEIEPDSPSCASFISQVRGLGVTAPVIVVSARYPAPPLTSPEAAADVIVAEKLSLLDHLPDIVSRALGTAPPAPRPAPSSVRPLSFVRLYHDGTILEVSTAALTTLGHPRDTVVIGSSIYGYFPDPHKERLARLIQEALGGTPGGDQLEMAGPDGGRRSIVARASALTQGEGLILLVFDAVGSRRDEASEMLEGELESMSDTAEEREAMEAQLAAARAHVDDLQQELEAARLASEESRASLEAEAGERERLQDQLREAVAAAAEAEAARQHAEELRVRETAAFAGRLVPREAEYTETIARATRELQALDEKLATTRAALRQAEERHDAARKAADARLTEQQAAFDARLAQAAAVQHTLERRLDDAVAALEQARQDHAVKAAAAAGRHPEGESDLTDRLAGITAARQQLEQQVADREAALRQAAERAATERQNASQGFARRQKELEAALTREVVQRRNLATKLAEAEASHQRAEQLRLADAVAAADKLAQQQAEFTTSITTAVRARDEIEQRMNDALAAIEQARQDRAADAAAAARHLAQREAELTSQVDNAATIQERLERRLADAEAARQDAERRVAEQQAAGELVAERKADLEAELARETASRQVLEQLLADAKLALQHAEAQHASEATAADARFAEQQKQYDAVVSEAAAAQDALAARLVAADAALQLAEQQHASEVAAAAARLAEHQKQSDSRLAETVAAAEAARQHADQQHASEMAAAAARLAEYQQQAERQLAQAAADAAATLHLAEQQFAAERQAAAEEAAERQAMLEAEIDQEVSRRQAGEGELDEMRAASEQAQRRFLDEIDAMRQRVREHEARLEERAARERAEWETTLAERLERIQHLQTETDHARKSLGDSQARIQQLESAHENERANFERARMALEADLARQREEYTTLQLTLDRTRATARETLERVAGHHATERGRLEALVAERDAHLREQAARRQAADETAAQTLAGVEHRLHLALEASKRDRRTIEQLQEQLKVRGKELDDATRQRDVLKAEANRVPLLRKEIDGIRDENRRRFDHAPVSLCRCSHKGAITLVNQAFARLLGYKTPEELLKVDFAATVCESADELQWIIDRCLASRSAESVETTWTRKDGSRIVVRVIAAATTPDSIDLGIEDITTLRTLEERLHNAQRMEAVARYASEVAVTCDNLLRNVRQQGEQWLAKIDSETARHDGELLFDDVTRATRFLRQLTVYGNEQKNAPERVDVSTVLRDLAPVLKRVAGGNIQLVLPKDSTPMNLDVEAELVERILVNVAAYGRERMPLGGRLRIEVASVVVDRKFVEKYPNVRPGAHVLLTVTDVRGAPPPDWSATVRHQASAAHAAAASDRPGLDVGVLQALVGDCGGHLWLMVEPPGNMVLKIHLPRRVLDDRAPAKRPGRWINRLAGVRH